MRTAKLPITHGDWQILRALVRAAGKPLTGKELRLWPSRRTKDGTFLDALVSMGVLEVVALRPEDEKTRRKPQQFRTLYKLTPKGEQAAEYGECEQTYGAAPTA